MSGRFPYDLKDKMKMQTESGAVQPCKLYFGEPGIRGWAGMAVGGGQEKERKKVEKPQQARKRVLGGGQNWLTPPQN